MINEENKKAWDDPNYSMKAFSELDSSDEKLYYCFTELVALYNKYIQQGLLNEMLAQEVFLLRLDIEEIKQKISINPKGE